MGQQMACQLPAWTWKAPGRFVVSIADAGPIRRIKMRYMLTCLIFAVIYAASHMDKMHSWWSFAAVLTVAVVIGLGAEAVAAARKRQ